MLKLVKGKPNRQTCNKTDATPKSMKKNNSQENIENDVRIYKLRPKPFLHGLDKGQVCTLMRVKERQTWIYKASFGENQFCVDILVKTSRPV